MQIMLLCFGRKIKIVAFYWVGVGVNLFKFFFLKFERVLLGWQSGGIFIFI